MNNNPAQIMTEQAFSILVQNPKNDNVNIVPHGNCFPATFFRIASKGTLLNPKIKRNPFPDTIENLKNLVDVSKHSSIDQADYITQNYIGDLDKGIYTFQCYITKKGHNIPRPSAVIESS